MLQIKNEIKNKILLYLSKNTVHLFFRSDEPEKIQNIKN